MAFGSTWDLSILVAICCNRFIHCSESTSGKLAFFEKPFTINRNPTFFFTNGTSLKLWNCWVKSPFSWVQFPFLLVESQFFVAQNPIFRPFFGFGGPSDDERGYRCFRGVCPGLCARGPKTLTKDGGAIWLWYMCWQCLDKNMDRLE